MCLRRVPTRVPGMEGQPASRPSYFPPDPLASLSILQSLLLHLLDDDFRHFFLANSWVHASISTIWVVGAAPVTCNRGHAPVWWRDAHLSIRPRINQPSGSQPSVCRIFAPNDIKRDGLSVDRIRQHADYTPLSSFIGIYISFSEIHTSALRPAREVHQATIQKTGVRGGRPSAIVFFSLRNHPYKSGFLI